MTDCDPNLRDKLAALDAIFPGLTVADALRVCDLFLPDPRLAPVHAQLDAGEKIAAIREHRAAFGGELRASKLAVDAMIADSPTWRAAVNRRADEVRRRLPTPPLMRRPESGYVSPV